MGNPNWVKGVSGNPKGRPPGGHAELEGLRKAVKRVEKKTSKKLYDHFIERAYENDAVLIALCKKFIPDLKQIDGTIEKKQLSLIGITLNPEIQELVSAFLGKLARLELEKAKPKLTEGER